MKRLYILLCIIALLSSCIKEEPYHDNVNLHKTITAVIEEFGNETKTALTEDNRLTWSEGDEIKIYDGCDSWETYRLKDSDAGSSTGTFEKTDAQEGSADFYCRLVVYPADMASSVHVESANTAYSIAFDIPDKQTYIENSFANGNFPMVAIWNVNPQYPISFKNLFGAIKLQLCGSKIVKSITISGHNNEPLAGTARVGKSAYSATPAIQEISSTSTSITLDCGEKGVQLHATEPTNFIIACPPTEFTKGFKVVIVDSEGNEHIKESFKNNAITRSSILKMPVYDIEGPKGKSEEFIVFEDAVIKELCVKAFDINEDGELSYGEAALVTDLSQMTLTKKTFKTFDELKYFTSLTKIPDNYFKSIAIKSISFPESLTEIGKYAFYQCTSLTDIEVRGNVGYAAFAHCSKLAEITFGDNTTTIDSYAFNKCSALTSITLPNSLTTISDYAFLRCSALAEIIIPASVESIGGIYNGGTFSDCTNLSKVEILGTVSFIPWNCFSNCTSLKSIILPETVTSIKPYAFSNCSALTDIQTENNASISIAEHAFENCTSLKTLSGFNNLTSIGEYAFQNCTGLETIDISGDVTTISEHAFSNCSSLKSLTINDGTSIIDQYAFTDCTNLSEVSLPNSLTTINTGAFSSCKSLTQITLPEITTLGWGVFFNCGLQSIVLPESLSEIPDETFQSCDKLEYISIPESIVSIGEEAFDWCKSLKRIYIPESVTTVGERAFRECVSLQEINIPESITSLGRSSFERCESLESIIIPESISIISDYAFDECYSLKNVTLPESITSLGTQAFYGCAFESIEIPESVTQIGAGTFAYCENLKNLTIPESINQIGWMAFEGCIGLKSISIPYGVTLIQSCLFNKCSSLADIELPESITEIKGSAFQGCSSLTRLTIPSSVTSIGDYMFCDCTSLESLILKPLSVPTGGGDHLFHNCTNIPEIFVPAESIDAYKSAQYWKSYKDNIFAIE